MAMRKIACNHISLLQCILFMETLAFIVAGYLLPQFCHIYRCGLLPALITCTQWLFAALASLLPGFARNDYTLVAIRGIFRRSRFSPALRGTRSRHIFPLRYICRVLVPAGHRWNLSCASVAARMDICAASLSQSALIQHICDTLLLP